MSKVDGIFWLLFSLGAGVFIVIRARIGRRARQVRAIVSRITPGTD